MKNYEQASKTATQIVNHINEAYNLNLLTVDSATMSEDIAKMLYPIPDTPTLGFNCRVMYEGNLCNAKVEKLEGETYTAVIQGTGVKLSNIPFSIWRPF